MQSVGEDAMSTGETLGLLLFALGVLTVWLYGLLRWIAAKENDGALSVPAPRIPHGNERFPRLRSLSPLSEDDTRLDGRFVPPDFSHKAAKGFDRARARDRVVGVDQVSPEERQRWIRRIDEARYWKDVN
jgi:hypothetical protein